MKIAVGSQNPSKLDAVKLAFEAAFPHDAWEVVGVDIPSGVSDQPMSDKESIRGAKNRARRSMKKINADFGVGLEGGLQKIGKFWFDSGWIVIVDKKGRTGIGSSVKMHTPDTMMKHIFQGMELGSVDDMLFSRKNSKQAEGHFGIMTDKHLTRTQAYRDAVISALSRFMHPEVFEES